MADKNDKPASKPDDAAPDDATPRDPDVHVEQDKPEGTTDAAPYDKKPEPARQPS